VAAEEQLLQTRRSVARWLTSATVAGTVPEREPVFVGTPQSVLFHATIDNRGDAGGLYRVALTISADQRTLSLRRQRLDVLAAAPTGVGRIDEAVILTWPRPLAFRYQVVTEDGTSWEPQWDDLERLPGRVALIDDLGRLMAVPVVISKDPRCLAKRGPQMLAGGECTVR
jgi:hypothetical protein